MLFSRQTWPRPNRVTRVALAGAVVLGLGLTNLARAERRRQRPSSSRPEGRSRSATIPSPALFLMKSAKPTKD